jgi:lycopene cyclase domain-containing protein
LKGKFWHNWKALGFSILIGGAFYITWDVIATARGDWGFSQDHTIGFKLAGLPIEEIMFFITVPLACIFIYHSLYPKIFSKKIRFAIWIWLAAAAASVALSFHFADNSYTRTVFLTLAGTIAIIAKLMPELLNSLRFNVMILISIIPFLIVNSILTGIPIVSYGPEAVIGSRIGSIPIEDFVYNLAMLSLYLFAYLSWNKHTPSREVDTAYKPQQ